MPKPQSFILIRYSALGDVALCLPVLSQLAQTYPHYRFYFVTKAKHAPLFSVLPENVQVVPMHQETIWAQATKLGKIAGRKSKVIDLHGSLRSRILCLFLCLWGISTLARIEKFRKLRRAFLQSKGQNPAQLPDVWSNYLSTIRAGNLELSGINTRQLQYRQAFIDKYGGLQNLPQFWQEYVKRAFLIIAPFASHTTKTYPEEQMTEILKNCLEHKIPVLLIGKGAQEERRIQAYLQDFNSDLLHSTLQNPLSLPQELFLFSYAKVALVMDSGNMHLCGLANIPIISLWGATSPQAGFAVWENNHILHSELDCWPCAIYGEKNCTRQGEPLQCLKNISPEKVWQEIKIFFSKV